VVERRKRKRRERMLKLLNMLIGYRTYIVSIAAGILAILIQADSQGAITLAPLMRLAADFLLVILLPMIPIFLRKGIENTLNRDKKKEK